MTSKIITNRRYCVDKNKKTTKRIFDLNGKLIEFKLCKIHSKDPDFNGFISETKINEVIPN